MSRSILLLLLLTSCAKRAPASAGPEADAVTTGGAPSGPSDVGDTTLVRMFRHGAEMLAARTSLVFAQTQPAKDALAKFATRDAPEDLRPDLQPYYRRMQETASRYDRADTVATVAVVLAETMARCGECHEVAGAEVPLYEVPVPGGDGVKAHMQRHMWAMDRLWEGIVAPSDERWTAGGNVLYEDALQAAELERPSVVEPEVQELADRVHQMGDYAYLRTVTEDRVSIVANLYTTCAECHTRTLTAPKE